MTKRGLLLVLLAGMLVAPQARADRLPFHLEVGGGPAWLAPSGAGSNNAGMDAFVVKPLDRERLAAALDEVSGKAAIAA